MRITVFGATGGVGGEIVRQALAAGHEVTAVVRDAARLRVPAASGPGAGRLVVARADPSRSGAALREAVAGRDAVLSGLGARRAADAEAGITTRLTRSVLSAMEAEGTRRLLVVSAAPLGRAPADEPLADRAIGVLVGAVYRRIYADLRTMEAELERSSADWTSVRPPRLLDGPLTGVYRMETGGNPRSARTIARADVAHAMLALVGDAASVRQGVGVAY
ncbi:NAD(P)-dependent oxidoreductase [Streptomyces sp. NPDC001985]|uniref:NAD(P)-dependent oxidoreductase n=1 Tax=Streptomyces sp. NPDC001985 TaxID=3154406 RepID=UPI003332CC07